MNRIEHIIQNWPTGGHHPIFTVWDMIQFNVSAFVRSVTAMQSWLERLNSESGRHGPGHKLTEQEYGSLADASTALMNACHDAGIDSLFPSHMLLTGAALSSDPVGGIGAQINTLLHQLERELEPRRCAVVETGKAGFFERDGLFGPEVDNSFPSAAPELKQAGTCIALGLNSAAVFHLMRVVELGLRALAKHLKIKKTTKGHDVVFSDWENIIGTAEHKLGKARQKKRGPKKMKEQEFYGGILKEFREIKDLWRNNVMHCREDYGELRALSAFNHVRGFMRRLATRVKE